MVVLEIEKSFYRTRLPIDVDKRRFGICFEIIALFVKSLFSFSLFLTFLFLSYFISLHGLRIMLVFVYINIDYNKLLTLYDRFRIAKNLHPVFNKAAFL